MGADSLSNNGYSKSTEMSPKVFRNDIFDNVLIGGTTSFRHLDLLRYSSLFDELDWYRNIEIDHKYMVTKFIPKVMKLFREGIISDPETERGGSFIVAIPGRLFKIQTDYSVLEPRSDICAVGSGEAIAMGSLITTRDMDMSPQDRIIKALEAAEEFSVSVRRPFRVLCTDKSVEEIVIE